MFVSSVQPRVILTFMTNNVKNRYISVLFYPHIGVTMWDVHQTVPGKRYVILICGHLPRYLTVYMTSNSWTLYPCIPQVDEESRLGEGYNIASSELCAKE